MKSCGMSIGIFGAALALFTASAVAQEGPVKLGVLTDMSSLYADNGGQGSVVAAQMAVDDFGGQVLGRSIQIVAGDHQNKADVGATIARRWLENENVEVDPRRTEFCGRAGGAGHHARQEEAVPRHRRRHVAPDRRRMLADRDSLDLRHLCAVAGNDAGDVASRRKVLVLHLGRLFPRRPTRGRQPQGHRCHGRQGDRRRETSAQYAGFFVLPAPGTVLEGGRDRARRHRRRLHQRRQAGRRIRHHAAAEAGRAARLHCRHSQSRAPERPGPDAELGVLLGPERGHAGVVEALHRQDPEGPDHDPRRHLWRGDALP